MSEQKYRATLSGDQGRSGWCVIFRHPVRRNADGSPGLRVRRGLGTKDRAEAENLVDEMNQILSDSLYWTPQARAKAESLFDTKIVNAFFDNLLPAAQDPWALRDELIPIPGPNEGYARARLLGTTGAGKTTLVRQLIGTNPKTERFPSTSTAKTTVCDIEVVMAPGAYRAVVTFFPREQVRLYIEESALSAGVASVFEKGTVATVAAKLLEHSEQRFRLSYILGTLRSEGDDLSDNDDATDADEGEAAELNDVEREDLARRVESYTVRIQKMSAAAAEKLEKELNVSLRRADDDDENAFQELFEDAVKQREDFHALVDEILDTVEERFELLDPAGFRRDRNDWPLLWKFETDDREEFIRTVNRFSSNYAPNFGKLLTPLVQGIRVQGAFGPKWDSGGECKLVLMDGEGLGHTPDSSASISTSITQRLEQTDAVVLVDNAEQPMQAAPQALLRTLAASGHEGKLIVCFTHFDAVKGDNLPDVKSRKQHVFRSLENAIGGVGDALGKSAENALRRTLAEKTLYVSSIQNAIKESNKLTLSELPKLVEAIRASIKPPKPKHVYPVYDVANLILCIPQAMGAFRDPWRARLRLPSRSPISPEHWTRIKALSRRFAELGRTEYDSLRPVADFISKLIEHVSVFLSSPLRWEPDNGDEDMKREAVTEISRVVYGQLHALGDQRLFHERVMDWAAAYSHSGTGSARDRARDIDAIYNVAAPVPGETSDPNASALVTAINTVVKEAVQKAGGKFA